MFFSLMLEAFFIAAAVSLDVLVSGFAYGTNKIRIPFLSAMIINLVGSAILGLALFLGFLLGGLVPESITVIIYAIIFIFLGLIKIFDFLIKNMIKRKQGINKEIKFSFFNFKFILNIIASPEDADINRNKVLSVKESIAIAIVFSLDGFAVGIGAGIANPNIVLYIMAIVFSLAINMLFLLGGQYLGNKIAKKTSLNLSWLSGLILIAIAIIKIFT